ERLGFNYRLTELQAAMGVAQLERASELLRERSRVADLYAERLGAMGGSAAGGGDPAGLVLACRGRGAERRSWFVYTPLLPSGTDRDGLVAAMGRLGIQAKAYMPCIHLMPHYRERFGFAPGQFPIAEEASARLLALPFFGGMGEEQVERVC